MMNATAAPEVIEIKENEDILVRNPVTHEEEEDDYDSDDSDDFWDHHRELYSQSCDVIRRKINMFLATKEMTQAKFLETIGHVNSNSYRNFMSYKGRDRGRDNHTFRGAVKFFYRREKEEKERKAAEKVAAKAASGKKRKASDAITTTDKENMLNQTEVNTCSNENPKKAAKATTTSSPGNTSIGKKSKAEIAKLLEDIQAVPITDYRVLDDCNEVRRKIAQFVQLEQVPMSKFAEAIGVTAPPVNSFLSKKGAQEGAGSGVYRDSYYFFEKLRILRNEPKSKHRLHSEKEHPNGYRLETPNRRYVAVFVGFPTK